ncbi:hypothetical protein TNCV_786861 [Trichonephila clavipes]|nr:hypothetical protein TNCV_786861 [Trichonephila clavipes]
MYFGGIPVLFGTFLFAVVISAQSADDDYLSDMDCIATSENQALCDEFMDCNQYLPQPVVDIDNICKNALSLNGPEHCTEDEQMFRDEDTRKKLHQCIINSTKDLTDEQEEEMRIYSQCVAKVGNKCQRKKISQCT